MTREIPFQVRQMADELAARLARPASRMTLGGPEPETPVASWFGRVTLAEPGEQWPSWNGRPMWPLCQIVVNELPHVPESIRDLALIRVFIDPDYHELDPLHDPFWKVRTSKSLDGLIAASEPAHGSRIRPQPARWKPINDLPEADDLPAEVRDEVRDLWGESFHSSERTKIGGWPHVIQWSPVWAPGGEHPARPEYVLQIGSEEKARWMWGDAGVAWFGRGTGRRRRTWAMEWQCA